MLNKTEFIRVKYLIEDTKKDELKNDIKIDSLNPLSSSCVTKVYQKGEKYYTDSQGEEIIPSELVQLASRGKIRVYQKGEVSPKVRGKHEQGMAHLVKNWQYEDNVVEIKIPVQSDIKKVNQDHNVAHVLKPGSYVYNQEIICSPQIKLVEKCIKDIDEIDKIKDVIDLKIKEYCSIYDFGNFVFMVEDSDLDRYKERIKIIDNSIANNEITYEQVKCKK